MWVQNASLLQVDTCDPSMPWMQVKLGVKVKPWVKVKLCVKWYL
jgi:hypothetical protein